MKGFTSIVVVVVALHLAALVLVAGPLHWPYLLVAVVSGASIWGVCPALARRRWVGWAAGVIAALAVQQIAFRLWRAQFAGLVLPLAQFTALHILIGFGLARLRRPASSHSSGDRRGGGDY